MTKAVQLQLQNLVDLAIGSPEVGAVNFNMLHTLLHVLVQQTNLADTQVEFKGPQAERIETIKQAGFTAPRILLTEYTVTPADEVPHEDEKETESLVGDEHEADPEEKETDAKERAEVPQKVVVVHSLEDADRALQPREISRRIVPGPLISPEGVLNMQELSKLEDKVSLLHQELARLQGLPSDEDVLERVRSSTPGMVVEDMWKYINLEKRIEAIEETIQKLSSLTQTLAKDTDQNRIDIAELNKALENFREQIDKHESGLSDLSIRVEDHIDTSDEGARRPTTDHDAEEPHVLPAMEGMEEDEKFRVIEYVLERLWQRVESLTRDLAAAAPSEAWPEDRPEGPDAPDTDTQEGSDRPEVQPSDERRVSVPADYDEQMALVNGRLEDVDQLVRGQLAEMQGRIDALERDLGVVMESTRTGVPLSDTTAQDLAGLSELYNKFQDMQKEVNELTGKATQIEDEQQQKQAYLESLLEELNHIRLMKADKEELELALEKKADQQDVKKKVSRSQFETISDDLMRGIDQALARLTEQEVVWKEALESMQMEMESKATKDEVSPAQEYVNQKLQSIQEKLKALQAMREETEAAGIKKKLLRNVNCISCDKDVVMRRENVVPSIPAAVGLPAYRSIRPYLTYELDKIRKQERRFPPAKNLRRFEEIMNEHRLEGSVRSPRGQQQQEVVRERHQVVRRYCGGSRVVRSAEQRARLSRDPRDPQVPFGPQVLPAPRLPVCGDS